MTKAVLPPQLLARISDVTDKQFLRYALFTVKGVTGKAEHLFSSFRNDIRKLTGSTNYKLAWFRFGDSIAVMITGTPLITSYVYAFAIKGAQRKLFECADVLLEGPSSTRFKQGINKLLNGYTVRSTQHSFGGSN